MAPELKKKKSARSLSGAVVDAAPSKKTKSSKTEKRKAAEDASPIPVKKVKSIKTSSEPEKNSAHAKNSGASKSVAAKEEGKKVKKAETVSEPELQPATDEDNVSEDDVSKDDEDEEVDTQTQALVSAFDSDDDDDASQPVDAFKKGQDVGKVPKTVKKLPKAGAKGTSEPGVMYLGRIPHGFAEREMKSYFSQFGEVTRLRLSRNKKTGRSKHFAFLEFADKEVADIVVQTMDNYLLYGHILRARVVPQNQVHPELWKGANRYFRQVPWNKMAGRHLEKPAGESTWQTRISKEQQRRSTRAEKLKEMMDYEYDSPALKQATVKTPAGLESKDESTAGIEAPPTTDVPEPAETGGEKEEEAAVAKPVKVKDAKKKSKAKKVKALPAADAPEAADEAGEEKQEDAPVAKPVKAAKKSKDKKVKTLPIADAAEAAEEAGEEKQEDAPVAKSVKAAKKKSKEKKVKA